MPTYDYRCKLCGHELEVFQSITDEPLKKCPKCGRRGLERLIGAGAGIIFKGSGFYTTDYKGKSRGHATTSSSSADKPEASSSGSSGSSGDSAKGSSSD